MNQRMRNRKLKWGATLKPGDIIEDCRFRNLEIETIESFWERGELVDYDILFTNGSACSLVHCCDPVEIFPPKTPPRVFEEFVLTQNHLKLIRHFNVSWQDAETGAPSIDPKRPYGNSNVPNDIHQILCGESIGRVDSKRDQLTKEEQRRYLKLHREMDVALEIVLATGSFQEGVYRYLEPGGWKKRLEHWKAPDKKIRPPRRLQAKRRPRKP